MTTRPSIKRVSVLIFSTLFLAACGGDSDSGSDTSLRESTSSNNTASANDTEAALVANDTEAALVANNVFSLARTSCGLGGLSIDDVALDDIAIKHANYIKYVYARSTPITFDAHTENQIDDIVDITGSNNPFFRGISFKERLRNANYSNAAYGGTENIARSSYYSSTGNLISSNEMAGSMAKSLLSAPYHLRSLMLPGSSVTSTSVVTYKPHEKDSINNQGYVLVNHASATQTTKDRTVSGIFTYPCQDVTDTVTALYNEVPDPFRGERDLQVNPIGQPIYVNMPTAKTIKVSNVKFHDVKRNIDIPVQLLDFDKDPYKGDTNYQLLENEAFILPITDDLNSCEIEREQDKSQQCGLYGNSEYHVSFDVLVDNETSQSKSFTFTTGEVNY